MKSQKKENKENKENDSKTLINPPNSNELTESLKDIKLFNDKMILSTSMKNKEIFLWSENSGTVAFTYNDENLRTFIPNGKIKVIDPKLYSEFFIYLHENKSLFNVWKTSDSQYYSKFSCTDEKISCFCISSDSQILYVGTVSGYIISYNLSLGKTLRNVQISKSEILKIEQIENIIIVLTKEKILIYKYSSFLENEINTQVPKEVLSYNYNIKLNFYGDNDNNSDNNYIYKSFIIENNKNMYLWSNNSIMILNIEDLKPYKLFHIIGENEEYNKKVNIDKINIQEGKIYFKNGLKEIFSFEQKNYKNNNNYEIKINKNNSMLYLPNNIKFSLGNISTFIFGTKNNIITGHEDGKICVWKQKTANALFFTYENMHQFHKGAITNILLLNKPISQYGLNFNKQISETLVNKVNNNKQIDKIKIKNSNIKENSVGNFIFENIEDNMNDILIQMEQEDQNNDIELNEENESNNEKEEKEEKEKKEKIKENYPKKKKNQKKKKK